MLDENPFLEVGDERAEREEFGLASSDTQSAKAIGCRKWPVQWRWILLLIQELSAQNPRRLEAKMMKILRPWGRTMDKAGTATARPR